MNILAQYRLKGRTAKEISASVEAGVRSGQLTPGDHLPPVRELAGQLGLSPTTVAAAYSDLRRRGLTTGAGRAGTRIRGAPPVSSRVYLSAPAGTRDLITGGPDPDLLPLLPGQPARRSARMYAEAPVSPRLRRLAAASLAADGIESASLTVTGGALDGIERVLATWLTPADRVAVEDPGHAVTFDLLAAMGFTPVPVPVDDLGIRPAELAAALARGAGALIVTPRAQAATGAAWDAGRAAEIGEVLRRHPGVGVIEDDHAGPVAGVPAFSACAGTNGLASPARWVILRSVSKSLGPDLRLAVVAGDEATITRVAGQAGAGHRMGELPAAGHGGGPVVGRLGGADAHDRGAGVRPPRRGATVGAGGPRDHGQRPVGIHLLGARRRRGRRRVPLGRGGLGGGSGPAVPHRRAARRQDLLRPPDGGGRGLVRGRTRPGAAAAGLPPGLGQSRAVSTQNSARSTALARPAPRLASRRWRRIASPYWFERDRTEGKSSQFRLALAAPLSELTRPGQARLAWHGTARRWLDDQDGQLPVG